jgi:hypothetical protein
LVRRGGDATTLDCRFTGSRGASGLPRVRRHAGEHLARTWQEAVVPEAAGETRRGG